jgi:hypothetical protein
MARFLFAIETSQGAAVEQLLEAGMEVYPLNPKSAQAYRQRKAPSGVKDDQLDAWSFADALRVGGQNWKPLRPEDALIKELLLLCRDEVGLIEQRTEINEKTDLNIALESLGRSKHRRVTSVTFTIKTQPTPKRRQTP